MNEIINAFNDLEIPLRVAGKGPLKEELASKSNEYIEVLGYISEETKRNLLSNCKGLIHNTIAEPFDVVMVEALASGAPILSVNAGNSPNLVEEGKTGVLFQRENGGITYQRPQSSAPIIEAVRRAESISWDHPYIQRSGRQYDESEVLDDWNRLFNNIRG